MPLELNAIEVEELRTIGEKRPFLHSGLAKFCESQREHYSTECVDKAMHLDEREAFANAIRADAYATFMAELSNFIDRVSR